MIFFAFFTAAYSMMSILREDEEGTLARALTERKPGHAARVVAFRAEQSSLTQSTRSAIQHALEALGVERFVDLSQLRAEYGEEVAYEALRKIVLDQAFMPPAPAA